ncbi:MAG: hypothetical protein B7C54_11740 [Acidimicrobiales bacterium mtb01]|nr:DEAD/DEAH box helicase [Actinomycetota bacterium]TEX45718.1 MAG: hypothetical protein B7C54_11740 [Acidimicrobiales bacterium mtb01]
MDRALDPQLLLEALGRHERLPTPDEIGEMLARAEINLFFGTSTEHDQLLVAGWYLHSIAGARAGFVSPIRRRQAGQVSAHIFDVFLQGPAADESGRGQNLRYRVAAQYGYLVGDLTPNAIALASQLPVESPSLATDPGQAALHVGALLLGLSRRQLRASLDRLAAETRQLANNWDNLDDSPFGPAVATVEGIRHLSNYLTFGDGNSGTADGGSSSLQRAANSFRRALQAEGGAEDTDSRWLAALLTDLGEDLASSSVWAVLPPDLHPTVRALVMAEPPVLMFWPPQATFLRSTPSPLDPATRRQVLAFPTSAGKTLVSQVIILSHIQTSDGDVCVVAPTHSLCREIEESLRPRLGLLRASVTNAGPRASSDQSTPAGRVLVMTPERFASLLRNSPAEFLSRFSLFVIDEAHMLAERERGWGLEEALTLVHHRTMRTEHRIVLVSAAMGTDAHIASWLTADAPPLIRSDSWRGPRRLYALFNTEWDTSNIAELPQSGKALPRKQVPIRGVIRLRRSTTSITAGSFSEPVGVKVRRRTRAGEWVPDGGTPQLQLVVPLIHHLVEARRTPTLVIVATREEARQLASWVAQLLPDAAELGLLADRVQARVGNAHALPSLIRRGVAYHHGALPTDVQAEIEDAARSGQIRCLIATATLTEGVNLPFKAVVVASLGYGAGPSFVPIIDARRLVNALGRAGRACRETEAWLFLVRHDPFNESMFRDLRQEGSDLPLRSSLTSDEALHEFAAFEEVRAMSVDAVLRDNGEAPNGFCAFVWRLSETFDSAGNPLDLDGVMRVVQATLAWEQADDLVRARWTKLVAAARDAYERTDPVKRWRFAQSGASLPGALALDAVRETAMAEVLRTPAVTVSDWLDVLLGHGRLEQILALPENRLRTFRPYRTAPTSKALDVDILQLLQRWVAGDELEQMGSAFLAGIQNDDYRAEALSEFSSGVFEHHLPWALGSLIAWINAELESRGELLRIPTALASYVHFGVATPTAVELMSGGVRSRRLAQAVAAILGPEVEELREQLKAMGLQAWRTQFAAHPAELRDLLTFVRSTPKLLTDLLDGQTVTVPVTNLTAAQSGTCALQLDEDGTEPHPLVVVADGAVIGHVASDVYNEVAQLLELGLPLEVVLDHKKEALSVAVRADSEP